MWNPEYFQRVLEENNRLLAYIAAQTEKTRKYILWGRILSLTYLVLILGSLVIGSIFLIPLIRQTIGPYQELLGSMGGVQKTQENSQQQQNTVTGLQNFLNTIE